MIRRPPRSTQSRSSAASDVYKRQVTYIITSEDQVKVYHTADSLPFPELAKLGQKEKFDVVFCTVGIAPSSTPQTGFEIAWLTKPQVAVPVSYTHLRAHE